MERKELSGGGPGGILGCHGRTIASYNSRIFAVVNGLCFSASAFDSCSFVMLYRTTHSGIPYSPDLIPLYDLSRPAPVSFHEWFDSSGIHTIHFLMNDTGTQTGIPNVQTITRRPRASLRQLLSTLS